MISAAPVTGWRQSPLPPTSLFQPGSGESTIHHGVAEWACLSPSTPLTSLPVDPDLSLSLLSPMSWLSCFKKNMSTLHKYDPFAHVGPGPSSVVRLFFVFIHCSHNTRLRLVTALITLCLTPLALINITSDIIPNLRRRQGLRLDDCVHRSVPNNH
ncbi:hypothetical protein K461DRAFT_103180 [Myriangium duriaei CBS 260.36]|uniref:Uncharacterized protein n=1 Tax=Myriangium duriaei CBS 260.36 TaxID=1168546 RepID=A0A9P4J7H2_9PEZI|nr:hypothetical protein K461DRAFT_103180 [Myriangium duriaei CBS 260.36]